MNIVADLTLSALRNTGIDNLGSYSQSLISACDKHHSVWPGTETNIEVTPKTRTGLHFPSSPMLKWKATVLENCGRSPDTLNKNLKVSLSNSTLWMRLGMQGFIFICCAAYSQARWTASSRTLQRPCPQQSQCETYCRNQRLLLRCACLMISSR